MARPYDTGVLSLQDCPAGNFEIAPGTGCRHALLSPPNSPHTSPCLPARAAFPGRSSPGGSPAVDSTSDCLSSCSDLPDCFVPWTLVCTFHR